MRDLAQLFDAQDPLVACLHGVDAGDAYALATRFDRAWGYRGGEALLWNAEIRAHVVHDRYMPPSPLRPFERRGLLAVDASYRNEPLTLLATSLGDDRSAKIRDLRFARAMLRAINGVAIAFLANASQARIGFSDLGFCVLQRDLHNLIVVRPSHAMPPPHTAGSHEAVANIERI